MLRLKLLEIRKNVKKPGKKPKSHEIEPNSSRDRAMHEGDDFRFKMNL
jgi:hypothetical protein